MKTPDTRGGTRVGMNQEIRNQVRFGPFWSDAGHSLNAPVLLLENLTSASIGPDSSGLLPIGAHFWKGI